MFSLLPVYHKAKSLDKSFSAWYKMLSNAVVQYLVSRVDLKEMAATIKQNNTPPPKKSGKQVQQRVQVWWTVNITALLSHRADFYLYWISLISILYVYTCLCVSVHFLPERGPWKHAEGGAGRGCGVGRECIKLNAGCQDGNDICFLSHQRCTIPAFVLQSCERPRFNACRLTMHCYYTVFMFTSCVIWPKESLQSESLMQNLCLYGCFSQWKNQYCRLDAQKWLSALWLTLKALGDWGPAFAVQGIECIRALIIVCSPYISLSLGLFFDNNYDCGV